MELWPIPQMLEFFSNLKNHYQLKIVVISNESRELTEYRIKKFKLAAFVDFFVSSCFVNLKKPDLDIYRLALSLAQANPQESLYIDDRDLYVSIAKELGFHTIQHQDFLSTHTKVLELLTP